MKTKFVFTLLISTLLMITTYSCEEKPIICYCGDVPFIYNYINHYGYSANYLEDYIANHVTDPLMADYLRNEYTRWGYFIKGVVTDKIDYGLRVHILDDLKGNMTDSSLITVWGNSAHTNKRVDILTQYAKNDTLLLMLDTIYSDNTPEKAGDYRTVRCVWSDGAVLQYANGFVTGYIHSLDGEMETMLWGDLQEELIDFLIRKKLP
jgi:hypothetical protein